jgi:O-antigen biosynthesis protein
MSPAAREDQLRAGVSAVRSLLEARDTPLSADELPDVVRLLTEVLDRMEEEWRTSTKRLQWSFAEQSRLEERLARLENGLLYRSMRKIGATLRTSELKLGQKLLKSPFHWLYLMLARRGNQDQAYRSWMAWQEVQTPSWEWHRDRAQHWLRRPLISIVMATHDPRREWLEAAVKSVLAQSYPFWELCICDDASPAWVGEYLGGQSAEDSRIRYCLSSERSGISRTMNRAGELANGEYIGFLDHDDVLSPVALHYMAESILASPADVIYSDEDYLDQAGHRTRPSFKPDWSPDLLTGCMYWGHFLVIARSRLDQIGWFRSECDGAQDYDVALRITDRPAVVRHVPRILYHWRQHPQSTASRAAAKRYTHEAGRRALQDAVRRRNWDAEPIDGAIPNSYYVRRKLIPGSRVSFIICSRSGKLLRRCLGALDRTRRGYESEIVVVHHQTGADRGVEKVIEAYGCEPVSFPEPFNFARMNNLGAAAAHGDILLFLNDDVVPLAADWMAHLLAHLQRPEVGVVGAKLVYRSGAIQHSGIALGMMEGTGHPGRGLFRTDLWHWLDRTRNVSAVTGACMGLRRSVFVALDGFNPEFPVNYNDVDLCLRARQAGYEVIYEPHALLRHDECRTRMPGTRLSERERFHDRWVEQLERSDPYFSPLLDKNSEEIRLA